MFTSRYICALYKVDAKVNPLRQLATINRKIAPCSWDNLFAYLPHKKCSTLVWKWNMLSALCIILMKLSSHLHTSRLRAHALLIKQTRPRPVCGNDLCTERSEKGSFWFRRGEREREIEQLIHHKERSGWRQEWQIASHLRWWFILFRCCNTRLCYLSRYIHATKVNYKHKRGRLLAWKFISCFLAFAGA